MKNAKEFIEFIERERKVAIDGGHNYTALILDELKAKIEGDACTEADNLTSLEEFPVKIGGEVYAVLMPTIPELDVPAKIKPWRVYGVGVNKDGVAFVVNEFEEIYKLDDEDEGLSFSTRERAEAFLKKMQGEGHDEV